MYREPSEMEFFYYGFRTLEEELAQAREYERELEYQQWLAKVAEESGIQKKDEDDEASD